MGDAAGLFVGPAPRVRTIPASAPFLDTLVDAILVEIPRDDPFALADAIIFLPNRRAVTGLISAFAHQLGGAALLPAIRPLGDLDDDPEVWGPEPIALSVAPEIAPLRRRFELAQLVRRRDAAEGGIDDPVRALAWADELCRLLDAAATVGEVDWSQLETLVSERDLAQHWRRSADFLKIIAEFWPLRLAEDGLNDPAVRRAQVLESLAREWMAHPPERPVIIAGSTGSVAATRTLMRCVAGLPKGCLVLPGLDTDLDEAWDAIDAQHPQFGLSLTLQDLGVARDAVSPLPWRDSQRARARRRLVSEALAPAHVTADWRQRLDVLGGGALIKKAAEGLTILEARNEAEESLAIAIALRETLETPGRTAALVTPDAGLARRVEARLERWGVRAQTSIGVSLSESPHGVLVSLLAALCADDGDPVALTALLAHPLVTLGLEPEEHARQRAALGRACLRGPRAWEDLDGLVARTRAISQDDAHRGQKHAQSGLPLAQGVRDALAPLSERKAPLDLAVLADRLAECAERLALNLDSHGDLWSGADGEAAAALLRDMGEHGGALGALEPRDAPRALGVLMSARECAPPRGGHPRIAILGPLEARLQRRDLMILGGLVEGVWPAPAHDDGFLSRPMRRALGLPEPEARIGLAAHDFAQLACAPEVLMTRAAVREGAPAVKSRWLWRLETLARAAGETELFRAPDARDPVRLSRLADAPTRSVKLAAPRPKPPAGARPKRISFTEVERLIRDPYSVYAQRVLGLERLDPPGAQPDPRHRGTAIHTAIEHFGDGDDPAILAALVEEELAKAGFDSAARRTGSMRLALSARAYVLWARARRDAGVVTLRETPGRLDLGGGRILSGRADRIDIDPSGGADVIDFKSGAPPTVDQVQSGLSPQLTLEAAALAQGAFDAGGASGRRFVTKALIYWQFGGANLGETVLFQGPQVMELADNALSRLKAMLTSYARQDQPYFSKPRARFANDWSDFDHFARRAEWADAEGGE